ncbi:MAG: hypothetical protein V3S51_00510 [Dehalococcoidia bacterium]
MVKGITGPGFLMFGLVVSWVGYALWRSPRLDWDEFIDTGLTALLSVWDGILWVWHEILRMVQDPLAVIGVLVMAVGAGVLLVGMRKVRFLVFGR